MKTDLLALLTEHDISLPEDIDNYTIMDLIFRELEKETPTNKPECETAPLGLI